jgi:hypothetical protein
MTQRSGKTEHASPLFIEPMLHSVRRASKIIRMTYRKKDLIPPRLLYKYRPFLDPHDSVRRVLSQNNWWFGSRQSFDDENDFIFPGVEDDSRLIGLDLERAKIDMQDALDKTGVFCLSESPRDPDLWRRYASDGAGICIELESDHVTEPDFGPFKVTYSDRPKPLWDQFAGADKRRKLVDAHLLQKSTFWKRQAEWRCIQKWEPRDKPTANRYYPIAARALTSVIFGWKMTEEERQQAIGWIQIGGWLRSVAFRQAQPENGRVRIRDYTRTVPEVTQNS